MNPYLYLKALHLIFVITWFAGLFYIPRLFIYQVEAAEKPPIERQAIENQLKRMARRLWRIIAWPSCIAAIFFALWLLILAPGLLQQRWMQVKLIFVALLLLYHLKTHQIYTRLQQNRGSYTSQFLRTWNEIATVLLFAIVFLAVLKNALSWVWGVAGIVALMALLMAGIKLYKYTRKKN